MNKGIFIFLIFISNLLASQVKLESRLRTPKDTFYLNETVEVKYYSAQLPVDGYSHPKPCLESGKTFTYIVCGDWGSKNIGNLNYLGCAAFIFKFPGKNKIPKVYLKYKGYDTIFSSNNIELYVIDKVVSERYLTKINHPDVYYRDSLDSINDHVNKLKLDSLLERKCKTQTFFLEPKQTVYNVNNLADTAVIEYSTNYPKFTCIGGKMNYRTSTKGGVQTNQISIKGKAREFVNPQCDKKDFSYKMEFDLNLYYIYYTQKNKIINVFAGQQEEVNDIKADGIIKFKVKFNKNGIYNFSPAYIDNYGKMIESVPVKVVVK